MRALMYCFDHKDVQISNDFQSGAMQALSLIFKTPQEFCQHEYDDKVDLECTPDVDHQRDMSYKMVVLLQN